MTTQELAENALNRAVCGQSTRNYGIILEHFMAKGIPADDIKPRENVLTYHAWRALGRQVMKGEHGCTVCVFVPTTKTEQQEDGKKLERHGSRPWFSRVFHVSQTKAMGA